jgi:hypothetical protein
VAHRPEDDVVAVDFDRNVTRNEVTEGEVILQAQKREGKKISH